MTTPLNVIAFHEAEHAIVAHELGLEIKSVIIDNEEPKLRPAAFYCSNIVLLSELSDLHEYVEQNCICSAGGYVADCIQFEHIEDPAERHWKIIRGMSDDKRAVQFCWPPKYKEQFDNFKKENPTADIPAEIREVNINWDGAVKRAREILEPRRDQLKTLAFKFYLSKGEIRGEEIHKWLR